MKLFIFISMSICLFFVGCKREFLDEKPSTSIAEPNSLETMEKILDYNTYNTSHNALNVVSCDDYYYLTFSSWESSPVSDKNGYIWKPDLFEGTTEVYDWNWRYKAILNANVVLDALRKLKPEVGKETQTNSVKGWALFTRAWAQLQLVQTFSKVYNSSTANVDLGIPLKLTANIDELSQRASMEETYKQIIKDLVSAIPLLGTPVQTKNLNRPSKPAGYALLSRTYLNMSDYSNASRYADSCLLLYNKLEDFNTISLPSNNPFLNKTGEVILYGTSTTNSIVTDLRTWPFICIDSVLYAQYEENDLRKKVYFLINPSGKPYMNRGFNPNNRLAFGGIATDEIYLIKAECEARIGNVDNSLKFLNDLLLKRYLTGSFTKLTISDSRVLLEKILLERRKELVFRGLRWGDLKRYNLEGQNITVRRVLNGQEYILPPNSPLYVLPIPNDEITRSGIQQNIR